MSRPDPMPGTHLARVDCNGCGAYVLAVPEQADTARCTLCWHVLIDARWSGPGGDREAAGDQQQPRPPVPVHDHQARHDQR